MSERIPVFYIHDFDSPQIYNMPQFEYVSCWQVSSVSSDAVEIGGYHGYCGFFTDFLIKWIHNGNAEAVFNGYTAMGGQLITKYKMEIIATSGIEKPSQSIDSITSNE